MFHCAGSDPGTGSDHAGPAQYTIIASDKSAWPPLTKEADSYSDFESRHRFRHENCRARVLLQCVAHKTGSLIHSQCSMIIVHHLQCQFAAAKFPGLAFASLQLNLIEICFCPLTP